MEKESNYYYEPTIKTIRVEVENANKLNINDFIPKQQLISFLKDKIKEYEGMYVDNDEALIILQEVLDFVNRGGKE